VGKTYYIDLPDFRPAKRAESAERIEVKAPEAAPVVEDVSSLGEAVAVHGEASVAVAATSESKAVKGNGKFASLFLIILTAVAVVAGFVLKAVVIDGAGITLFDGLKDFFAGKVLNLAREDVDHSQTTLMALLPTTCFIYYFGALMSIVFGLLSFFTGRGTTKLAKIGSFVTIGAAIMLLFTTVVEKSLVAPLIPVYVLIALPMVAGVAALASNRE